MTLIAAGGDRRQVSATRVFADADQRQARPMGLSMEDLSATFV